MKQLDIAIDGRHLNFVAERRLRHVDADFEDDVAVFALEVFMLLHMHDDVQVALRGVFFAHVAFAAHLNLQAFAHARRDIDGERGLTDAALIGRDDDSGNKRSVLGPWVMWNANRADRSSGHGCTS